MATKKELIEEAERLGVPVKTYWSKADIESALLATHVVYTDADVDDVDDAEDADDEVPQTIVELPKQHVCDNHPDKEATYTSPPSTANTIHLCSPCAKRVEKMRSR